jgi:uncharacterized protein (TIGR03086 family)
MSDLTNLPDLRPDLYGAYEQAAAVSAAVRSDQLAGPTSCAAMDVAALLDHLVFAARRAAALGRGETPAADVPAPHLELAEIPAAVEEAGADARDAWADDGALTRKIEMPWGETYPGSALVGIYLIELATHGWDVAHATAGTELLDERLASATLTCAQAGIKPEYRTPEGNPFGPELEAPPDATAWERLAAFMGREPR